MFLEKINFELVSLEIIGIYKLEQIIKPGSLNLSRSCLSISTLA